MLRATWLIGKSGASYAAAKGVDLSCFEVSQDYGSFISTFKYDDAHLSIYVTEGSDFV